MEKNINVESICDWYIKSICILNKYPINRKSQYKCKILKSMIEEYCKTGNEQSSKYLDVNFLYMMFKIKINGNHKKELNDRIIKVNEKIIKDNIYGVVDILTKDKYLIKTIYSNQKVIINEEDKEYYRLYIGMLYYLLGINKENGYIMTFSFKKGLKIIEIDKIYNKNKCEHIIDQYKTNYSLFKKGKQINAY